MQLSGNLCASDAELESPTLGRPLQILVSVESELDRYWGSWSVTCMDETFVWLSILLYKCEHVMWATSILFRTSQVYDRNGQ